MKWFSMFILAMIASILVACSGGRMEPTTAAPVAGAAEGSATSSADIAAGVAMTVSEAMTATEMMAAVTLLTETQAVTETASPTEIDVVDSAPEASVERPVWQELPLVDVRTGATFRLADFAGKTVFVEPMATWCTNCRQQLGIVRSLRANLQDEDVVFIGLSVETNLDPIALAHYANDAGFDWPFVVSTPELLQALVEAFGRTITNPPATPHVIIRPDGSTSSLNTGIKSAEQLLDLLQGTGG